MAFHRDVEGAQAGYHELRRTKTSWQLAVGSLACPGCDAPVLPPAGGVSPAESMWCAFCDHTGFVRDFLSLGEPTRPTHVVVRIRHGSRA